MANVTIPNLTSATTIAPSTDLMVLEQTEGTRKATLSQIFTSSATSGSGLGITSGGVYTIKSGLDSDISDINTLLGNTSIASIGDGTVTGAVSKINSDLTWKLAGRVKGNKTINIPTSFHELHVVVKCPSANEAPLYVIDHLINSIELSNLSTSANTWLIGGGSVSDTNHFRAITIIGLSHTTISTANVTVNNQDYLPYTITELYYR